MTRYEALINNPEKLEQLIRYNNMPLNLEDLKTSIINACCPINDRGGLIYCPRDHNGFCVSCTECWNGEEPL
jgi:hypothetical protein